MSETSTVTTAYHEAGHAVATWLFGYGSVIKRVSIAAEADFLGILESSSPLANMDPLIDGAPEVVTALENDVVILCCGAVAQKRFDPRSWRQYHGGADRADALELTSKLGGSVEDEEALFAELYQRSETLIAEHWAEVQTVARELLTYTKLSGEAVVTVLEATTGRQIPRSELFDYTSDDEVPEWVTR